MKRKTDDDIVYPPGFDPNKKKRKLKDDFEDIVYPPDHDPSMYFNPEAIDAYFKKHPDTYAAKRKRVEAHNKEVSSYAVPLQREVIDLTKKLALMDSEVEEYGKEKAKKRAFRKRFVKPKPFSFDDIGFFTEKNKIRPKPKGLPRDKLNALERRMADYIPYNELYYKYIISKELVDNDDIFDAKDVHTNLMNEWMNLLNSKNKNPYLYKLEKGWPILAFDETYGGEDYKMNDTVEVYRYFLDYHFTELPYTPFPTKKEMEDPKMLNNEIGSKVVADFNAKHKKGNMYILNYICAIDILSEIIDKDKTDEEKKKYLDETFDRYHKWYSTLKQRIRMDFPKYDNKKLIKDLIGKHKTDITVPTDHSILVIFSAVCTEEQVVSVSTACFDSSNFVNSPDELIECLSYHNSSVLSEKGLSYFERHKTVVNTWNYNLVKQIIEESGKLNTFFTLKDGKNTVELSNEGICKVFTAWYALWVFYHPDNATLKIERLKVDDVNLAKKLKDALVLAGHEDVSDDIVESYIRGSAGSPTISVFIPKIPPLPPYGSITVNFIRYMIACVETNKLLSDPQVNSQLLLGAGIFDLYI